MKKTALALAIGTALIAGPAMAAKPKLSGEEQLAKIIDGRVPGKPVSCISLTNSRDQRVIDKTAIVYGNGSTIYVNRPSNPRDLDRDDIMVTNVYGTQLCKMDIVRTHDRSGFFYNGFVGLQDFVPYSRVAAR